MTVTRGQGGNQEAQKMALNEKPETEGGGGGDMEDIEDMAKGSQAGFPNRELRSSVSYKSRKNISKKGSTVIKFSVDPVSSDGSSGNNVPGSQTIYLRTFGCSHNQSDSQYMAGQLAAYGYSITEEPEGADLWLINTCTVKNPSQSAMETIIRRGKDAKKPLVVAVCVPQGNSNLKDLEGVSIVGVQQIDRVVEVVEETLKGHEVRLLRRQTLPSLDLPKVRKNKFVEIIPINVGCLGPCKTKHARGHRGSYTVAAPVERVRSVIADGVKEIWLSSEDTGAYGRRDCAFPSDISRFHEIKGVKDEPFVELPRFHEVKGVREMVESFRVREVPSYYVKPVSERRFTPPSAAVVKMEHQIPCIDLEALSGRELHTAIADACRDWGFFQVLNHGLPSELVQNMARQSNEFFYQPLEEKMKCSTPARVAGPVHFGGGGNRDWRDVLKLNCAPAEIVAKDYWPQRPAGFRDTMEVYSAQQQALAVRLLKLISESLGLESNYLVEACGDPKVVMAINHYPPCPDPSLTMGIKAHSDPNTITMLLQDDVGGLQVFKDDRWIDVRPLPSALVINVGDQLQILSNGKYSSCLHRVVNNNRQARTSIATFFSPSHACTIGPAPGLVDEANPAIYPNIVYADYIKAFYSQSLAPDKNGGYLAGIMLHKNYNSYATNNSSSNKVTEEHMRRKRAQQGNF